MASYIETIQEYTAAVSLTKKSPTADKDARDTNIRISVTDKKYYLIRVTDAEANRGNVTLVTTNKKGITYNVYVNVDLEYYIKAACASGRVTIEDGSTIATEVATEIQTALTGKIK